MTTKTEEQRELVEAIKCKESCEYFLDTYGWIKDPVTQQVIPFKLWPHERMLLRLFGKHQELILLKAKQLGCSWTASGYALHTVMFKEATNVLMMSKGQDEAWELLGKARFIYDHLKERGPFLQFSLSIDQAGMIGFEKMDSRIKALPATKGAGVGETATVVIEDEWDFHPYAEENYGNLKATVGDGAQFIGMSTVDKTKAVSFFKTMYKQAKAGENNFTPIFLPWNVRPDRDDAWLERQKRDFPPYLIEQNYPATEEEALSPPQTLSFFPVDALKDMLDNCIHPIEERQNGFIKIYKKPVVAKKYCCGVDVGEGVGGDHSVAIIIDAKTGETVAVMASNTIAQDLFSYELVKLCREYNDCLLAIEKNVGQLCINKVDELGYKSIYYRDTEKKKSGWETTKSNKPVLLGELEEAVRNREAIVWDRDTVSEMFSFIRNEGRLEAQEGAHDDRVIALAIAWRMRGEVKPMTYKITSRSVMGPAREMY